MAINGVRDKEVAVRAVDFDRLSLAGKKLVTVGGPNGLGRAITRLAVERGADVEVVGRTFRDQETARLTFVRADLSSMREAVDVARRLRVEDADVLLFTNGIFAAKVRQETVDHVERDMAVSYLSRVAMLRELVARLGTARPGSVSRARVLLMAAPGSGALGDPADLNATKGKYSGMRAHLNTVAANEALVLSGADRLPGPVYFGLNPGAVKTGIRSNFLGDGSALHRVAEGLIGVLGPTPEAYARRIVPLLFSPDLEGRDGLFFNSKGVPIRPSGGMDRARSDRFFHAAEDLLRQALP